VNDQNSSSGGLSRKLALVLGGFVLISSLALVSWINAWNQRQSLEAFRQLAVNNAAFLEQMRLPRTPEMAKRLARVLDMGVGFRFTAGEKGSWPPELEPVIKKLTSMPEAAVKTFENSDVATAPVGSTGTHLILIRQHEKPSRSFFSGMLIPALGLAVVCSGLGLVLARTIVYPLGILTQWLPNLEVQADAKPPGISPQVTGRQDEIGRLAQALEQTAAKLSKEQKLRQQSERLATLGRIATSLAHEIKNPAAAIQMHADLLESSMKDCPNVSVELIKEEVDRITDLVNQWLFVAKSKPGNMQAHDLGKLLQAVCRRLSPQLDHAKVVLQLELEENIRIEADAARMEQALRNPLINAAQAMPNGGVIHVQLFREKDLAIVKIEDEGKGFSPESLQHFGEPFYTEKEGGMGIGLTLAKEVLEAHGGSISPENKVSSGAIVNLHLPIAK
jgi:signal transduction histidine kinase